MNIVQALADPKIFPNANMPGRWLSFLRATQGLPLEGDMLAHYQYHTKREDPPKRKPKIAVCVVGRRGRKSSTAAYIAAHRAAFHDYSTFIRRGEDVIIPILASDKFSARSVSRYLASIFEESPVLKNSIDAITSETIRLTSGLQFVVRAANPRTTRGKKSPLAIFDETSFWRDEATSRNPDREIYRAILPSLIDLPNAQLIIVSSAYRKTGLLYNLYKKYFGVENDRCLVWKATSLEMNPSLDSGEIEAELAEDPEGARAEYLSEFRQDIADLFDRESLEACIEPGKREAPPLSGIRYFGFVDLSGGRSDAACLAISHFDKGSGLRVLDLLREVAAPHSPAQTVAEFATALGHYRCSTVLGDAYAAEWPVEEFRKYQVVMKRSELNKSAIYLELLGIVNGAQCTLLDNDRMINQLAALERKVRSGGKDSVDHCPGAHDDAANACAGALVLCKRRPKKRAGGW